MRSEELSERALSLTSHALRLNPSNYNVWTYRRKILRAIKYDPTRELCLSEEMIRESPKNFHAWEHRRLIANDNLSYCDADTELKLTESILEIDAKSYHAWQHRHWTIQTHKYTCCGLTTSEMKFTESLLLQDVRNNSAWNQRFCMLKYRGKIDSVFVRREFAFAVAKIKIAYENESAWNYLRGILSYFKDVKKFPLYQEFLNFVENEYLENQNRSRHLMAFMIDTKIEMILEFCESNEIVQTQKVLQLCNLMSEKYDKTRKTYWKFVYKKFYYDKIKQRLETNDSGGAKSDQSWKQTIGKKMNEGDEIIANEFNSIKVTKGKKMECKKKENFEKAKGFGTDLLFEIMNKYNQ